MMPDILLYLGSSLITLWGIAHIAPTKNVVHGFDPISADNKRIITMEWIAEGLTLCFIGILALLITIFTGTQNHASLICVSGIRCDADCYGWINGIHRSPNITDTDKDLPRGEDDCGHIVLPGECVMNES